MTTRTRLALLLPLLLLLPLSAASAQIPREEKAKLALVADRTAYQPGEEARIGVVMTIEEDWHTNSHEPTYDWLIPTDAELTLPEGWPGSVVDYPDGVMKRFAFTEGPISVYDGTVLFVAGVPIPEDAPPGEVAISAAVRYQACDHSSCLPPVTSNARLTLTVGPGGEPANDEVFAGGTPPPAADAGGDDGDGGRALLPVLLLALVGGLILNVMPCVLPVLSIKVFGLVKSAGQGRRQVTAGSLATTAGILVSFWALAGAAVAAQTAGAAVGWGTQFQHPGFVTFLAVVVVLFCLNLWGLFEIPLPAWLSGVGGSAPREGLAGHFGSGLFATLMATPCSAPFLGTAIGFALAQRAGIVFAIFTAIGLGMALPYLLLAVAPGVARVFPRPGAWMDHVRKAMGFLLAAAAVWLLYVLASQVSPERLALIELGLLGVALFVWMRSQASRGPWAKKAAAAGIAVAVAGTLALSASSAPFSGETAGSATAEKLIDWQEFDRTRAMELADRGKLVFVDVTADWCITCKANERLVLETAEVARTFAAHGVVPMKADWTNRNDAIGAFLADFGKAGIPFYVLYRPGREPHVFSELLTRDGLISAVRASSGGETAELR